MTEVVHMNDDNLRIRTKLLRHQLPTESPSKIWGGRATNEICAVCDDNILGMSEIEAESADGRTRFYHVHCYQLLCLECRSVGLSH